MTAPDANYGLDGVIVPNFSDRNEFRLPDYYRLDVSYTIKRGLLRTVKYKDSFTFSVYNLLGQAVIMASPNSDTYQVDMTSLDVGIYLANIKTETGIKTIRIIKK